METPQRTPPQPPHKPPEEPHPPKKPGEPDEPPDNDEATKNVVHAMTAEQFHALLRAVRQPVVDERRERRQKMWQERNRQEMKESVEMQVRRFRGCNHMQLPGSVLTGCSRIAWATQSDNKRRGPCQRCGTIFSPVREECISDEIWKAYATMIRIPTHPAGHTNFIFQTA
jgi:hypothetical protein